MAKRPSRVHVQRGDTLLTPKGVAQLLGVSIPTVYDLPIKHLKFGKVSKRYPSTFVREYIEDSTVEPDANTDQT